MAPNLPFLIVRESDVPVSAIHHVDLLIRPAAILAWLVYKKETDPYYEDVIIDAVMLEAFKKIAKDTPGQADSTTFEDKDGKPDSCDSSCFSIASLVEAIIEWFVKPL